MQSASRSTDPAVEEIRRHVVGLFDAFLAGDTEALKEGRTSDWKGFQIRSTRLVRGLEEYSEELSRVIGGLQVDRYEFLDFEVEVEGDLALVFYIARDYLKGGNEEQTAGDAPPTVLIRSLDIYRRIDGSWTQTASNICAIADPPHHSVTDRSR